MSKYEHLANDFYPEVRHVRELHAEAVAAIELGKAAVLAITAEVLEGSTTEEHMDEA